ncbi:MAG: ATP-grasp domain-containing protein, partial [Firmicutes bacterium]|nr:ATP-grasp domain-containing protein [Bacillota bacterium]
MHTVAYKTDSRSAAHTSINNSYLVIMMKVYIQSYENGMPRSYNFMYAYYGFREMGFETESFCDEDSIKKSRNEDIIVGYVDTVRSRLRDFGITAPEMDYPEELKKYFGRKIYKCKMSEINNKPEKWPVFIKPIEDKQFTGVVVRSTKDLIG